MASGNPLPIETYLKNWEEICSNFYTNDDKLAGTIVGLVEFASHSNGEVTLNFSNVDQTMMGKTEDLEPLFNKIGFNNGVMLLPKEFDKYLENKRKIRSEFHRKKAKELRKELNDLLNSKPAQYTALHRRSELSTFINQYKSSVGAKPFIKALLRMLQLQLKQSTLISWTFLDDIFTQNGPDFMRASVNLLVNVLGFTHTVQQVDESGRGDNLRTWYMNSLLSDTNIKSLIGTFPKENSLGNVGATGSIELSSQQRPIEMSSSTGNIISRLCYLPIKILLVWWSLSRMWLNFCFGIIGFKKNIPEESSVSSELRV
ncbi:1205_t:CDS:1 [Funneliformis geosporum]|uniref:17018_t:CDS:1 n=1 Tax=Funneliformis geosporum TaxID=1117311 RepID=A0A9W4WY95_9GLOM|nr:1205_t:CDS:1 [Funneliformis geosporum]CAI2172572.1 17018_t:CDS:1 [Funneliformis geosporum]